MRAVHHSSTRSACAYKRRTSQALCLLPGVQLGARAMGPPHCAFLLAKTDSKRPNMLDVVVSDRRSSKRKRDEVIGRAVTGRVGEQGGWSG